MDLADLRPSKIIAVHLNYGSRARERGRVPSEPSYFLKPPSSLGADREPVTRPLGCEALVCEGEIALVIGTRARRVEIGEALGCIGWVCAAGDFGLQDLRWADRGSNLLSKGQDGFTPLGPRLVPLDQIDADSLVLRTVLNGETVQEASADDLIFPFEQLVADLSRLITLEPGDVILTGTPASPPLVEPGDQVEISLEAAGSIQIPIVGAEQELAPYGAMPKMTPKVRAEMAPPPVPGLGLSDAVEAALREVATATLTHVLQIRGIRNSFLTGLRPTRPDLRLLGRARTLRLVALREDVAAADTSSPNVHKGTVDTLEAGQVLVVEARGVAEAGTIGDLLALRAHRLGAAGVVTDGAIRDTPIVGEIEIPTYCQAAHGSVLGKLHYPLEAQVPITCAGVLVMPGDLLVGDAEGVVVIPAAMVDEVSAEALERESQEAWAAERIDAGESIASVYPIAAERVEEYELWKTTKLEESA